MLHTRRLAKLFPVLVLVALALPGSAFGQATRTWVSGVGDDANPCSRTAPCKTFAGAISKTAARGEINCLDPGGFGGVTITKSLTIRCDYTEGGVLVSGTNAIVVNAAATDRVILRGLDINGIGTGLNGIRVLQAKSISVYDSQIYGFVRNGFDFEPTNAGAKALVQNTTIENNTGNGVLLAPPATGTNTRLNVRRSTIVHNGCGLAATNHGPDAMFNFASNCGTNAAGAAGNGQINAVDNVIADNDRTAGASGSAGVFTNGQSSVVRIGSNFITGNSLGLRAIDVGTAGIHSWGDNYISANNTANGTANGTIAKGKRRR